ncbi:hypothetical protein F0L74_05685 [Chitinophaga agrisoli]|uniref:Uncharacterized protein n=1 Tax=Chitinophaga agrisoli TaxID=2607653 RepID=A0A5B2W5E5_9BACT|nr:hypothetical protein [Chitinophaga agrisoli]KAA2245449.1 hypothetical protein F0L74_05685 [Chitinophaga agrisoli]
MTMVIGCLALCVAITWWIRVFTNKVIFTIDTTGIWHNGSMAEWAHIKTYKIERTPGYRYQSSNIHLIIRFRSPGPDMRIRLNGLDIDMQDLLQHITTFSAGQGVVYKGMFKL